MKKSIKTMLAAMLIAALLPVMPAMADGAVAALTQNPELIPESPLFSDPCDSTSGFYNNGGLAPSTALDNAGNSVLKLTRTTDDFRFWKWVDSQSSTLNSADGIVYQFDFYTASNATNWDSSGLLVYSRGHNDGGNDTNFVSLRPNPSDPAAVQIIRGNKNGKVLASFSANAWHTLAFAITHESGSRSFNYDIYVDGVLTVEDETLTLSKDNMHFFGFRTDNWWWANSTPTGDEYFIDNVYAYAGPALTAFIPEPEKTSYSIDLTSIYNMSTWAYYGDTVSDPTKFSTDPDRGAMAMSDDDSQTSYTLASEGVTFDFDRSLFHADTMNAYFGERNETVTIGGHAKFVKNIYIIASNRFNGYDSYTVQIEYKDGSSETQLLPITVRNQQDGNGVKWNELPSYAGVYNNSVPYGKVAVEDGKIVNPGGGADAWLPIWKFAADPSKEIDTVSITSTGQVGLALFGMAETVMTTEDMQSVIAQAKALDYVKDTTDAALVKKAAVFAQELYEREAATLEENQKVFDLLKQAEAQETKYLDLSDRVDVDLIVKENDARPAGYAGRDILLHKAGPSEITLVAPGDSNYIDQMTGTKFKLSGGYEGNGNDAVAVEKDGSGVAFALDSGIYKEISFLIDDVYPDAEGVNYQTGNTVDFVIYFEDGTTKEVTADIFRSDSWYSSQYAAHYRNPSLYYDGSKYVSGRGTDNYQVSDDLYTAFGTKITEIKPIESVELVAPDTYSYNVFAITAVPVSNSSLIALADAFIDSGITDPSEVTAANAQDVADQTSAIIELYNRGYDAFEEEDIELAEELHSEALMYLLDDGVLNFVPSVSAAGGNVTASVNMMNTTISNKNYVLIVAAYDANGKLVALNATAQKTLAAGTSSASDSVSVAAPANAASYKAIVWDSINSMIPIAVASR